MTIQAYDIQLKDPEYHERLEVRYGVKWQLSVVFSTQIIAKVVMWPSQKWSMYVQFKECKSSMEMFQIGIQSFKSFMCWAHSWDCQEFTKCHWSIIYFCDKIVD